MDENNVGDFLEGVEQGVAKKQDGEELSKKLTDDYMARMEAFWQYVTNQHPEYLNKQIRYLDIYGQLFMAFESWLASQQGRSLSETESLAMANRFGEFESYMEEKIEEWDAQHPQ